MIWFSAAWAQEVVCRPVAVGELEAALATAEQALVARDLGAAEPALDQAKEQARCLGTPVERATLGRLAWDQAELAAWKAEEELAFSWVLLARDSGVASPPDRVGADHPLAAMLAEEPEIPPVTGPTGVRLAPPRKGTMYADGSLLAEPQLRLSSPHLLQVFDHETLVLSTWQSGAAFPSTLLDAVVKEGRRERETGEGVVLPPPNWKPAKENTVEAYKTWAKKHPEGPWYQDALDGLDDLAWADAQRVGTELAARQYLHDHPDGLHVDDALFAIEHLAYLRVMADPSRAAWEKFLAEAPPDGSYATEARQELDFIDWSAARAVDTPAAYRKYLEQHPEGRQAVRAGELEEERTFDELLAKHTDSALRDFLDRWPSGGFADEAHAILGEVRFRSVTVSVTGPVEDAVRARITSALKAEFAKRGLPVVDAAHATDSARIEVSCSVKPNKLDTDIQADLAVQYGTLDRPLLTLHILSKMLPTDDAGKLLGEMLSQNLAPLDRWTKGK